MLGLLYWASFNSNTIIFLSNVILNLNQSSGFSIVARFVRFLNSNKKLSSEIKRRKVSIRMVLLLSVVYELNSLVCRAAVCVLGLKRQSYLKTYRSLASNPDLQQPAAILQARWRSHLFYSIEQLSPLGAHMPGVKARSLPCAPVSKRHRNQIIPLV